MVEKNPEYEKAFARMHRRNALRRWFRRGGCAVLIVIWLGLMSLPCAFITLMTQKEIVFSRGELPEQEWRLFLIEEPDERGLGFSAGSIESGGADEGQFCIKTTTRYFLWEGSAETVSYCNCYEQQGERWSLTLVGDAECQALRFSQ